MHHRGIAITEGVAQQICSVYKTRRLTDITLKWMEQMRNDDPSVRAGALGILAKRRDKTALPAVLDAMRDDEEAVREILADIPNPDYAPENIRWEEYLESEEHYRERLDGASLRDLVMRPERALYTDP